MQTTEPIDLPSVQEVGGRNWLLVRSPDPEAPPRLPLWSVSQGENTLLDLVAGPFADQVSEVWGIEQRAEFFAASDRRRHIWFAWLASERERGGQGTVLPDFAYEFLTYAKSADILEHAFGRAPRGMKRALGLLGSKPRSPEFYRALGRVLLAGGARAKILSHERDLDDAVILALDSVPEDYADVKPIVRTVLQGRAGASSIGFLVGTAERLRELKGEECAAAVFSAADPVRAAWHAIEALPFPAPPWPACPLLKPITGRAHLLSVAKRLRNCLRSGSTLLEASLGVLGGVRYYYEVQEEPALAEFIRIAPLGWYLRQVRGPENSDLSETARVRFERHLATLPGYCGPWCDTDYCWRTPIDLTDEVIG